MLLRIFGRRGGIIVRDLLLQGRRGGIWKRDAERLPLIESTHPELSARDENCDRSFSNDEVSLCQYGLYYGRAPTTEN